MNRQAINLAPTCPRHKQREGNAPEEIAHKDLGPAFYEGPGVRPGVVKPGGGDTKSPTSTDPMVAITLVRSSWASFLRHAFGRRSKTKNMIPHPLACTRFRRLSQVGQSFSDRATCLWCHDREARRRTGDTSGRVGSKVSRLESCAAGAGSLHRENERASEVAHDAHVIAPVHPGLRCTQRAHDAESPVDVSDPRVKQSESGVN